ncbi:MAG: hypothetical protein HZA49_09880 [Planctomycetes bacterium]|nr:hypothetical protein [Planctomycetota bacterium]
MNVKRYLLAALVAYIVLQITTFVIHGVILTNEYMALGSIWRPDMMSWMWLFNVLDIPSMLLITYIFVKGYENKGIMEGVRFGLMLGTLMWIGGAFANWITFPITLPLAIKWFVFGVLQTIITGITLALIYRPKKV